MNDCILFTTVLYNLTGQKVYVDDITITYVNKLYDEWCESFYIGSVYEYDTPSLDEMRSSIRKFIIEKLDVKQQYQIFNTLLIKTQGQ